MSNGVNTYMFPENAFPNKKLYGFVPEKARVLNLFGLKLRN